MLEAIQILVLACQINIASPRYDTSNEVQKHCQKKLLTCFEKEMNKHRIQSKAVINCIKER